MTRKLQRRDSGNGAMTRHEIEYLASGSCGSARSRRRAIIPWR
jgi:hypothetical protein